MNSQIQKSDRIISKAIPMLLAFGMLLIFTAVTLFSFSLGPFNSGKNINNADEVIVNPVEISILR